MSWLIGLFMMTILALIHAELGAAYPVAGGTARYPYYAFGSLAGFIAGWTTFLQAIAIAPIEVTASIDYVNAFTAAQWHFNMIAADGGLNAAGSIVAAVLMLIFCVINLVGAKFLSESNTGLVIWKTAVPLLTVVLLMMLSFNPGNFVAGGGFLTMGWHGVFSALPIGVVFALQGFEQATQMAGEAENPQRDVAKAIILAMAIGGAIYLLLEVAFIGALKPENLLHDWSNPLGLSGDDALQAKYGPYYSIFMSLGLVWMAVVIVIDAIISPFGTGLIYIGTTARISYALGLPRAMTAVSGRGVPWIAVLVASVIGYLILLPRGQGWQQQVSVVTGATAFMYAFAPISLRVLNVIDPKRPHPYRAPLPGVLLPFGFACGSLLIYWGGWDATWKIILCLLFGAVLYAIAGFGFRSKAVDTSNVRWTSAIWMSVWLGGLALLSFLGNFGDSDSVPMNPRHYLPADWDSLIVLVFAIAVFYLAISMPQPAEKAIAAIEADLNSSEISGVSMHH